MYSQFDEFFEDLFNEAMAYDGEFAVRDRQFTHYVLGKIHNEHRQAWQETSRELVDYVQARASFVFGERTGFGIIRLAYSYAVIRWDEEIFWKKIDPVECSLVIEEAKNDSRFADVTVLPLTKSEETKVVDEDLETSDVHEVVFGQVYIDRCLATVKKLLDDPSFVPHCVYEGDFIWFENEELGKQFSVISKDELRKLHADKNQKSSEGHNVWFNKKNLGYLVTGVFSAQLSFLVDRRHQFTFDIPVKHRKNVVEFSKLNNAYIPTVETKDNVAVPISLDTLLGVISGDTKF